MVAATFELRALPGMYAKARQAMELNFLLLPMSQLSFVSPQHASLSTTASWAADGTMMRVSQLQALHLRCCLHVHNLQRLALCGNRNQRVNLLCRRFDLTKSL